MGIPLCLRQMMFYSPERREDDMPKSKLEIAKTLVCNLHRIPGALYREWYGPTQTIDLTDDEGNSLNITIIRRWVVRNSKRRLPKKPIIIKGLSSRPMQFTAEDAMKWVVGIAEKAADLRGYEGGEPPVDQHTHTIDIPDVGLFAKRRELSVRNAIRLYFAVNQIINDGPTYFTQKSCGGLMNIIDTGGNPVPDIRLKQKASAA